METIAPNLEQALFWMNIYRDLLAADEGALARMRSLISSGVNGARSEAHYSDDLNLVVAEIERVRVRLDHWLAVVDSLS